MNLPFARLSVVLAGLLALMAGIPRATAGDFQPGSYTWTDKDGVKAWHLHFTQDPKVRTYFRVTGSVGSIMRVPVQGGYNATNNRLSASWAPIPGTPFGLADISGSWRADQDTFVVNYHGGPAIPLKFDSAAPDPTALKLAIKNLEVEPAVSGALLKGRFTVSLSQFKNINPVQYNIKVKDGLMAPGLYKTIVGAALNATADGDHVVDFAGTPITVPLGTDSIRVSVDVFCTDAEPYNVSVTREIPVAQQTKPVVVGSFDYYNYKIQVEPDQVGQIGWEFALRSIATATGHKTRTTVFETVTITSEDRPGEVIAGPRVESYLPCSPEADVSTVHFLPVAELKPGPYHAVVRLEGPDLQTYNGVIEFWVKAPSRNRPPGEKEDPAQITGAISLGKTSLKPKEETSLTVTYGFDKGPRGMDMDAEIEIVDPDGRRTAATKRVSLRRAKKAEHRFNISSPTPGVHTVKVRVVGESGKPWSTSATFTVENPVAPTTQPPPKAPGDQQGSVGKAEQGTFGLVKKVVGKAPEPGVGPYGTASGSISQNACSFQWVAKPPDTGQWSVKAAFSTPPAVLRPGDIIELTCSGSASESGTGLGAMGIGCGWGARGGCEVIEHKKFFIGRASDGKFYSSGEGKTRVRIESGGKIILTASQGGFAFGSGAIWDPCEYHYEWNATPIDPKEESAGKEEEKKAEEEEIVGPTLTPTGPDPLDEHVIHAWLDKEEITLFAGETGEIVDVHIEGFRTSTLDRVEVLFPQKTDNWASLPGRIIVDGGDGSYDPANMGRPVHVDGYFFSARHTALRADVEIDIIVRQNGAGEERLKLLVHVVPKPAALDPLVDPGAGAGPGRTGGGNPPGRLPIPPAGGKQPPPPPQGNPSGPAQNFAGRWATTFGPISLTQDDTMVSGTYPGGVIRGTVAGNTLTLRMDERALTPIPGFGRWVLNANGDEFTGAWSDSRDMSPPRRPWSGRRVTTGGASPHKPDPRGAMPTDPSRRPEQPRDPGMGEHKPPPPRNKPGSLDLNPGSVGKNGWNSVGEGGAGVTVEGDALVFDVPKASLGAAESFAATPLDGDFDLCIDYELVDWKAGEEWSLSWSAFLSPVTTTETRELIQVMRTSDQGEGGFGEVIVNPSPQAELISAPAVSDRKGTIRIARTGNRVEVWQADGANWKKAAAFETGLPGRLYLGFVLERQGEVGAKVRLMPKRTR